jgi:Glycosyltransferase family 87
MTPGRRKQLALLLVCIAFSTLWSYEIRRAFQGPLKMPDFAAIYYGARCAILHQDPYNPSAVARQFKAENAQLQTDPMAAESARLVITVGVNLPTSLFAAVPFALLPWQIAQNLWMLLSAALLALAAFLICDLTPAAPIVSGCLAAFMLLNCEELLTVGNLAGVVISLCLIAAWCFLKNRFALTGVVLLAVSLILKPHDAGLVWLYFLLAGGSLRKRALQTLAVAAVIGILAAIWIATASPHWIQELHNNLSAVSAPGSLFDPSLMGLTSRSAGEIIDLQAALSIFKNNPRFYAPVSYLLPGSLILIWAIAALRKRFSHQSALFALAAISALSLLPLFHRTHDAKILLLTIPACALLWAGKAPLRWIALILTSAAIFITGDIPLLLLLVATRGLPGSPTTLTAKLLDLILLQPVPLILLATGFFYLWVYLRSNPAQQRHPADPPVQFQSAN